VSHNVRISLLGREYTLYSSESEEQVHEVVRFVEQKLAEISGGKSVDTRDLTVLTLLNLAGQYIQLKAELRSRDLGQEERLSQIVTRLEQELESGSTIGSPSLS